MKTKIALAFVCLFLLSADKKEPEHIAREITMIQPEFGDTAQILHIIKKELEVKLVEERGKCSLLVDAYKNGKRVGVDFLLGLGLNDRMSSGKKDQIAILVQVADLNYLPLLDAKKDHCRVLLKVGYGSNGSSTSSDREVPMSTFDFSKANSGSVFGAKQSSSNEVPLLWLATGKGGIINGGNTVAAVVQGNEEVAIFKLLLEK